MPELYSFRVSIEGRPAPDGPVDLPTPQPESARARAQRLQLSQGHHSRLRHWLLFRGSLALAGYVIFFVVAGLVIGWRQAYDVSIGITSPAATASPVAAWPLSVAGWLFAPALAGAVAGYVVSAGISSRRTESFEQLFTDSSSGTS